MKRLLHQRKFTLIYIVVFTLIMSLLLTTNPLTDKVWRGDSSIFIYFGKAMRAGKSMYTDIFDHKGPVIFVLNYLGTFLPGRVTGVYWIELVALFGTLVGVYKTGRLTLKRPLSLFVMTLFGLTLARYLQNGNLTESYALPLWVYSLYLFQRYYHLGYPIKKHESILVGASIMVTFLLRANLILSWVPLIVVLMAGYIYRRKWGELKHCIIGCGIGLGMVGLAAAVLLYVTGIWNDFIYQAFSFNFLYLEKANWNGALEFFLREMLSDYSIIWVGMYAVYTIWYKRSVSSFGLMGALILTLYSAILSGRPYLHYLMLIFPIVAIMISELLSVIVPIFSHSTAKKILALCCVAYIPLIVAFNTNLAIENPNIVNWISGRTVMNRPYDTVAKEAGNYIRSVTTSSDSIYSLFEAGRLYLLSDRLANTKYFSLPAVDFNQFPEILEDFYQEFDATPPKVVVLKHHALADTGQPFVKQLNDRLQSDYELTYSNARYDIFIRKNVN